MFHLDTAKPGRRAAHSAIETTLRAKRPGSAAAAAPTPGQADIRNHFPDVGPEWHDSLVRIVNNYLALSFVEYPEFKVLVSSLNKKATVPGRREVLSRMRAVKRGLESEVALMLDEEFVAITTDGWTSRRNDSYMSLTAAYIDSEWELHHLSLDCAKHTGTTTGENLAKLTADIIERHDLTGRVTACVTDCEPSMVKAGRLLEGRCPISHVGCANHRMESTTPSVFNGRSLRAMSLAQTLVGRYKKSSQMAARLADLCVILQIVALCVMQKVETRW